MTKPIPLHIYFVLDRSGSMLRLFNDVIGGFNSFIADQKARPGKCRLTLVQFDSGDPFEIIHNAVNMDDVPELTKESYSPRGSTPLLDAEGNTIALAEKREADRKAKGKSQESIIFATYTDGLENFSHEWTFETLSAKKREHEDDWAFLYLGVGHDAYDQSVHIGTRVINTYSGAASARGMSVGYDYFVAEVAHASGRANEGLRTNSSETKAAKDLRKSQ